MGANISETTQNQSVYQEQDDLVVGIDLGTTFSCVGIYANSKVSILKDEKNEATQASHVYFSKDGLEIAGNCAKKHSIHEPLNTVSNSKRLLSKCLLDPSVQKERQYLSYEVTAGDDGAVKIKVPNRKILVTPEEVSSKILMLMKRIAESNLNQPVKNAVITVPAYFNNGQRKATMEAGRLAGLNVVRLLNEPTSAAIAYGITCPKGQRQTVMVYDLGGGTFDISLLEITGSTYRVIAVNGDTHLGGEDFDNLLVLYISEKYQKRFNFDLRVDATKKKKLKLDCENLKIKLSKEPKVLYTLEAKHGNGKDALALEITREAFEEICKEKFRRTMDLVEDTLRSARLQRSEVNSLVLIGGSTRIPKVSKMLEDYFGKKPYNSINPDEAVAYGAAIVASKYCKESSDKFRDLSLYDVVPLSIGFKGKSDEFKCLINRNTPYPVTRKHACTNGFDFQKVINIPLYQGERPLAKDNFFIGLFQLENIPLGKAGKIPITVQAEVDGDGILKLKAYEEETKKGIEVVVSSESNKLSEEDIQKALVAAEKNKEADDKLRKQFELIDKLTFYADNISEILK